MSEDITVITTHDQPDPAAETTGETTGTTSQPETEDGAGLPNLSAAETVPPVDETEHKRVQVRSVAAELLKSMQWLTPEEKRFFAEELEGKIADMTPEEVAAYADSVESVLRDDAVQSILKPGSVLAAERPTPSGSMLNQVAFGAYNTVRESLIKPLTEPEQQ